MRTYALALALAVSACGSESDANTEDDAVACVPGEPAAGGFGWDPFKPFSSDHQDGWAAECERRGCMGRKTALCIGSSNGLDHYGDVMFAMVRPEGNGGERMKWIVWNEFEPGMGEQCEIDAENLVDPEAVCGTWGTLP